MRILFSKRWSKLEVDEQGYERMGTSWRLRLIWEPRDLWVGIYYDTAGNSNPFKAGIVDWFICIIPCLPINISRVR